MVRHHPSPWFSSVFVASIAHRNHLKQSNSSVSKAKFRQVSNLKCS